MSQIKSAFKNMSWLLASQIITSVCAFVWTILITRYLGVNNYGVLAYAVSINAIFAVTMDLGISTHIVRSIVNDKNLAADYLGSAIPLKSILAIISFVIILSYLIIIGRSEFVIFICMLFTIKAIIQSICNLFYGSFQAFEKAKYQAISNIIHNVLTLVFILIAIFTNLALLGVSIAYLLASITVLIYSYFILNKQIVKPNIQLNKSFYKQLLIWGLPFALTGFFYTIYYSIDVVMLNQLAGNYASGIYNATYKLINVLTLFYSIYTAVFFPIMTKYYKNNVILLKASFEKSVKYLLMITIPISVFSVYYSTEIISLVYRNQYLMAGSVLQILIWTVCFLFVNGACSILLNASHREVSVTKIYGIAAFFNIVLNLFLIPNYSFIGAAIATVLSEVLILVLAFYALKSIDQLPNKYLYFDIAKIIFASLILAILLQLTNMSFLIAIPISIIVYLIAIFFVRILDDDDKYIIKQIINK